MHCPISAHVSSIIVAPHVAAPFRAPCLGCLRIHDFWRKEVAVHAGSKTAVQPEALSQVQTKKQWRPSKDDVDRISRGGFAKVRGTGSRDVPHRLNASERPLYEGAKKKGFLAVRGTGYRRERKGTPLPNIYRQWCDANSSATIVIEQDMYGGVEDTVVVDLATLRLPPQEVGNAKTLVLQLCRGMEGVTSVMDRPPDAVPFNILSLGTGRRQSKERMVPLNNDEPLANTAVSSMQQDGNWSDKEKEATAAGLAPDKCTDPMVCLDTERQCDQAVPGGTGSTPTRGMDDYSSSTTIYSTADNSSSSSSSSRSEMAKELNDQSSSAASLVEHLKVQVAEAAAYTRDLKEEKGMKNQDPEVKQSVAQLLQLKANLEAAQMAVEVEKKRMSPSGRMSMLYSAFGESSVELKESSLAYSVTAPLNFQDAPSGIFDAQALPGPTAAEHRLKARSKIVATWQLPAIPLFFSAPRSAAKKCAAVLSEHLIMDRIILEAGKHDEVK